MYLVGSDFEGLQAGNDALTELRERHPDHPLASVARVVQGTNAAREFKQVGADNSVTVRKPDADDAVGLLGRAGCRRGAQVGRQEEGGAGQDDRRREAAPDGDRPRGRGCDPGVHRRAAARDRSRGGDGAELTDLTNGEERCRPLLPLISSGRLARWRR